MKQKQGKCGTSTTGSNGNIIVTYNQIARYWMWSIGTLCAFNHAQKNTNREVKDEKAYPLDTGYHDHACNGCLR